MHGVGERAEHGLDRCAFDGEVELRRGRWPLVVEGEVGRHGLGFRPLAPTSSQCRVGGQGLDVRAHEAVESLDPSLLLGGRLDLSNDLLLTCIIGAVVIGVGQGIVVRQQATTGGTDIVGMLLQKFAGIKFSTGILLADGFVVLSGLVVIGFGLGTGEASSNGWMLTLYSLITIYVTSRVIAYLLDGASYDKLLFIISDHHEEIKRFIIDDMERGATYLKGKGMFTDRDREVIFLVISRKEVHLVQNRIREIDPRAFVVVTDAYETFGEGFKQFPDKNQIQAE